MSSSGSHLSKEMLDLIKQIGDSRSKQEEDKIILKEVETLKVKLKQSNIKNKLMKEYLMRAIYIEMLGHDAPFIHFQAVNLTQDKNIMIKRVGYLASNLLLNENSECLIMLVSTLQKDIASLHWIEICMALMTIIKFATSSIIVLAVIEQVYKLLDNKSEHVRKKAVACLHRFHQVNPQKVPDINDKMRKMLCDFDPSVMASSLNFFHEAVQKNPLDFKDLVSSFVVILKQVIEHKLPRDYDYHRLPAPWIQMKILQILAFLGKDDQVNSEGMYEMLSQVLRRADDTGINIGYAIVYQCLRTICIIYPNHHLLEQASNTISRFLSSESPNLRCTGINGLSLIIQINQEYVSNHQQVIVDCLEENDETLKKNTFELLYKMTDTNNVEIIVDKMMNYLKTTEVEGPGRKNILFKIKELAELYAPDKRWFIKIMNQLFVNFGSLITEEILSQLIKILNEWSEEVDEEEFKQMTIINYCEIVNSVSNLCDHLVQLIAYIFGEYSLQLANGNENEIESNFKLLEYLLEKQYDNDKTKAMILTALTKIHINLDFQKYEYVGNIMVFFSKSKNVDIQQKANEYLRMKKKSLFKSRDLLSNSACREVKFESGLSFLNSFVRKKIEEGGKVYTKNIKEENTKKKGLNIEAYPELMVKFNEKEKIKTESVTQETQVPAKSTINKPKDIWTVDGIKNEEETKPKIVFTPVVKSSNPNTFIKVGTSDDRFKQVKGDPPKVSQPTIVPVTKKKEEKYDPKKEEKDILKNQLFGTKPSSTVSQPTTTKNQVQPVKKKEETNKEPVNLLELDSIVTPQTPNTTRNSNQPNLIDIFGIASSNQSEAQINNNVQSKENIAFDDIFNMGLSNSNSQNKPLEKNNNDVFALFEEVKQTSTKSFLPHIIDTDTFGELWVDCPNEEITITKATKFTSPKEYFKFIEKQGVHPIEIIEKEAIAAGVLNGNVVLLHATIEDNGLSIMIKSGEQEIMQKAKEALNKIFN